MSDTKVLSGYKEIASFLGVSIKTVQRHLNTIPVARFGTKIAIEKTELLKWIQADAQKRLAKFIKERSPRKKR